MVREVSPFRVFIAVAVLLASSLIGLLAGSLVSSASAAYQRSASMSWVPDGPVYAMVRDKNRMYIGGNFTSLRDPVTGTTKRRNNLAALNATTGRLLNRWNPGADGTVRALAVGPDRYVYVGGAFTSVAGTHANRLAAVTRRGKPLPGWSSSANDTVYDMWANSRAVYVAGSFSRVKGSPRPRVARLRLTNGDVVTSFNADVEGGRVRAIAPSSDGQNLILGGRFTTIAGQPRAFAGAVSLASGAPTSFAPARACEKCNILDLTSADGRVFASIAGPGGHVVAWDLSTSRLAWSRSADGDCQAIDYYDGMVYAGGHFGPVFSGRERHQLAVINASSGTLQDYSISFTGHDHPGVWSVLADETGLRLGGGFRLAGSPVQRYALFRMG